MAFPVETGKGSINVYEKNIFIYINQYLRSLLLYREAKCQSDISHFVDFNGF